VKQRAQECVREDFFSFISVNKICASSNEKGFRQRQHLAMNENDFLYFVDALFSQSSHHMFFSPNFDDVMQQ
jgi:hypothetical protein